MNKNFFGLVILAVTLAISCTQKKADQQVSFAGAALDRTSLPIKEPTRPTYKELDVHNASAPARFEVKAPKGAPNVVVILIDAMGFGVSEAFGGPVTTPNMDNLAANGLKYNRFHTTALCFPTRVALLTGYNHHSNNMGCIGEAATTMPGNTSVRPQTITPMAEVLRQNGYNTAAFGKYHETPPWEISIVGPQDRWPTRCGFEKFYGFIGGETNQWAPLIYDGVTLVETPDDPNYHFTTDMTNQAISWVRYQKALAPDKPFFMYYAPGATHAPHHVPQAWIDKYKGKFDQGWDKMRELTLERQKKLGIVPQNTKLGPKPADIKDWDKLSADEKKLFARQMEVYAGFAEQTDYEAGRLISTLKELGVLDNTIIIFIAGDNGASAEGQMNGMFSEMTYFNAVPETVPDMLKQGMGVDIFIELRNTAYTITSEVTVDAKGNGVIVCQGGRFGGLSFYLKNGKPAFSYNYLGMESTQIIAAEALKPGNYKLVYDFKYDGSGMGKGGVGKISVNGKKVAEKRIEKTQPGIFSVDDLADVGIDDGTHVADYGSSSKFNGQINYVTIEKRK